ncbi:TorF family putative porin [Dyella humicola]|uniref:TorF family putative porin n=1 Tax=Dyella humicola TaxID=2992126 RepID=UPI00224C7EA0
MNAPVGGSLAYALLALGMGLSAAPPAQAADLSGTVALSSQLVDRGQAVSPQTPILQGAGSYSFATGWSLGLSASTEVRSPDHIAEALAQVSRDWSLATDWQMQAGVAYYDYPGNARARPYERVEGTLDWIYRDVLTFGLSAIYGMNSQVPRFRGAADVNFHWPLPAHFSFSAGAGVTRSAVSPCHAGGQECASSYEYARPGYYEPLPAETYGYGHAGLIWSKGSWHMELDRVVTSGLTRPRGSFDTAPWLATVSLSF